VSLSCEERHELTEGNNRNFRLFGEKTKNTKTALSRLQEILVGFVRDSRRLNRFVLHNCNKIMSSTISSRNSFKDQTS
jgi:hypothetical protein